MAKRHKYAGATLTAVTELPLPRIAELCEDAARHAESVQRLVRLEESTPGLLVYSVRNRLTAGRIEFMTFAVSTKELGERRELRTQIRSYKQKRNWPFPWEMIAWSNYRDFMRRLGEGIGREDPSSSSSVVEMAGAHSG